MKKLAGMFAAAFVLALVVTTWAGEAALPKDLDSYTHTGSLVIPDKNSPLFGFFHYYMNNKGLTAFKKGGPYPEGTIIVGKVYDIVTSPAGGMIEGKILRYSYMKKDVSAKETGGWIFAAFSPERKFIQKDVKTTCFACHMAAKDKGGTHAIVAKSDPRSAVSASQKKETCARCHQGANDNFAALVAHKPIQEIGGHIVPHVIHVAFSYLTTLTLLFFAFHVFIDFLYELRQRLAARKSEHGHAVVEAAKSVVRFDIHQRAQHWLMLSGVILLGITGWPLRGAGDAEAATYSASFMKLFGGAQGAATWHRVGAVLIIASSLYHLFYLTFLASKKRLPMSMLPMPKDALDMRDNILFMLGLKKERPKFERYMYLEKFDYWAVFWGIVMMVGTGFIFWFPAFFASWAPSWLITAALIIHGEEATLAILFLFVVHFYNVHLKPSIFPMNWAWLNGRISVEALKHEHPLEYERMKPKLDE